jgi:hypothetical protein
VSRRSGIAVLLAVLTVAVYARSGSHDFVRYDDDRYVTENPVVRSGLSLSGVRWAFTTGTEANWHPLTWLSLMLDAEIHGLRPAGFHWTNVLLHTVNTVVLFELLLGLTGARWRSALVAALFALHPLHVEVVAWVTARKDLLCTLFAFLSMSAWVRYARTGERRAYVGAALLLTAGLLSKGMIATLPLLLLLLDWWPLGRLRDLRSLRRLVVEKLPLFALCAASAVVTFAVQRAGGAVTGGEVSLGASWANALVSYVRYLGKTLWPSGLSVLYPHPYLADSGVEPWAAWQVAGAAAILVAISLLVLRFRHHRYATVGWLWFLVSLLPVIGIVPFGRQAMADRYTYVPLIGLFLLVVWAGCELVRRWRIPLGVTVGFSAVLVGSLALVSWLQLRHWSDSLALFRHAVETTPHSSIMHYNTGNELKRLGRWQDSIEHYRRALEIEPAKGNAHFNLAGALMRLGRRDEAVSHYREALRLLGDTPRIREELERALEERPKGASSGESPPRRRSPGP